MPLTTAQDAELRTLAQKNRADGRLSQILGLLGQANVDDPFMEVLRTALRTDYSGPTGDYMYRSTLDNIGSLAKKATPMTNLVADPPPGNLMPTTAPAATLPQAAPAAAPIATAAQPAAASAPVVGLSPAMRKRIEEFGSKLANDISAAGDSQSAAGNPGASSWWNSAIQVGKNTQQVLEMLKGLDVPEEMFPMIQKAISSIEDSGMAMQAVNEYVLQQKQIEAQNKKLNDLRNSAETQVFGKPGASIDEAMANSNSEIGKLSQLIDQFESQIFGKKGGSLGDALSDPNSELGQLAQILRDQQSSVFQRELSPLINQNMASQGLLDSGANIEQQAKALGGLERSRQGSLLESSLGYRDSIRNQRQGVLDAALNAREQIRNTGRSDAMGDIGYQQQALANQANLMRTQITMRYQQMLEDKRAELARELSQMRGGGSSTLQQILGGVGSAASIGLAPWTGGASLAALPGFLGMAAGPMGSTAGSAAAALGQSTWQSGGAPKQSIFSTPGRTAAYNGMDYA